MIKAISKTSIHFGLSTHALSGVMRTTDNFSLTETLKFIRLISNISGGVVFVAINLFTSWLIYEAHVSYTQQIGTYPKSTV